MKNLYQFKDIILSKLLDGYKTKSIFIQKKALYTIIAYTLISLYMLGSIAVLLTFEGNSMKYTIQIISSILTMLVVFALLKVQKLEMSINLLMFLGYMNTLVFLPKPLALQFFIHIIIVLMISVIVYLKPYQLYAAIISANVIIWFQVFVLKNHIVFLTGDTAMKTTISLGMIGLTFSLSAVYLSGLINDQIMATTKQKHIAITDHLTGLYKRQYFYEVICQYARSETYYIVMADIDHFKEINDTYGHKRGDDILTAFSQKTLTILGDSGLCFRWGGEEFLFCVREKSLSRLMDRLEKYRLTLSNVDFGLDRNVTVSIGICGSELDISKPLDDYVTLADKALYMAKDRGRNRIEYLIP